MITFKQWLKENLSNQFYLQKRKPSLGNNYKHYMCDQCGNSFNKSWVDEFGLVCSCGAELQQVEPENLERGHEKYKQTLFNNKVRNLR